MFKEVADIKTSDQLHLPVPEAKFETVVAKPSDIQKEMVQELSKRAAEIHSGTVDASVDNMLCVTNDGRKIGLDVLNSERAYITNTLTVSDTTDDSTATETSDFKQYEKAITVTDTYHETKTRFTWIGEIQNERLHAGLEKLSDEELQLVTLYFHEKYSTVELSKVYGIAQQNISKRILKITKFLKNFDFQGVE